MNIEQINERYTCYDILGKPAYKTSRCCLYHVPWRSDNHPSLSVYRNGSRWQDKVTGEGGSVVDLIGKLIGSTRFEDIIRTASLFSFPSQRIFDLEKEKEEASTAYTIHPLYAYPLKNYLQSRGIPIEIARNVISELRWDNPAKPGQTLYTIAYPTDAGGYMTRNLRSKRVFGRGGITTHLIDQNANWCVLEGFFDHLSWVTLCGGKTQHNILCLNSVANVRAAIDRLTGVATRIYLALDNDQAGDQATAQLTAALPTAIDIRDRFAPYNDLNDFLCMVHR